jgi:hypothetical protein
MSCKEMDKEHVGQMCWCYNVADPDPDIWLCPTAYQWHHERWATDRLRAQHGGSGAALQWQLDARSIWVRKIVDEESQGQFCSEVFNNRTNKIAALHKPRLRLHIACLLLVHQRGQAYHWFRARCKMTERVNKGTNPVTDEIATVHSWCQLISPGYPLKRLICPGRFQICKFVLEISRWSWCSWIGSWPLFINRAMSLSDDLFGVLSLLYMQWAL